MGGNSLHKASYVFVLCSKLLQTETDGQGAVYPGHGGGVKFAHAFFKAFLVDSPYLFKKHDAVFLESAFVGVEFDVCGQLGFVPLTGYSRGDNGGAVLIPHVVLDDKYGTYPALLRAYHRTKIRVIKFQK